ncbi:MAG: bifunctional hydroxymethylpyrimidine kinase/phosphomethylpyrimidine kinase, partial [Syntrophaceae bacterium]|nr:bifunctional hydroxymethylpyrimidine kinase/phosphomethylpyrimidine kinase [Syntrophaceae bacterium]
MMKPARVLTIAGSDSGGGAGIQADLKTITVLGGFGMSVITALTAQNTRGVQGIFDIPPEFVAKQFDAVLTDIGVDAAKTGMLARQDILEVVIGKIREYRIEKLVVDPVMVAKGGSLLIRGNVMDLLKTELIPLAWVVTPNIPEAEV